jgi:hypothetical protein
MTRNLAVVIVVRGAADAGITGRPAIALGQPVESAGVETMPTGSDDRWSQPTSASRSWDLC